jgi:hypothetical protein
MAKRLRMANSKILARNSYNLEMKKDGGYPLRGYTGSEQQFRFAQFPGGPACFCAPHA